MRLTLAAAALALLAACGGGSSSSSGTTTTLPHGTAEPSVCVSAVRNPAAAFTGASDLVVQDLGEFDVNQLVTFTVPSGTTSFSIVSQEVGGSAVSEVNLTRQGLFPNTVVPDQVKDPSGTLYYDDNQDLTANHPAVYWGTSPLSGTFTAPNTTLGLDALRSSRALPSGTWTFLANDWANECAHHLAACTTSANTGVYHLWAVTKSGPFPVPPGTLDVDVYLLLDPTDGVGTTAVAVAANAQVQRWERSLGTFLGNGGITLGTVTYHDLPTAVHQQFPNNSVDVTGAGPCDPLQQLFTSSSADSRGVSLFLIHELVDRSQQGNFITIGIDGTIPGPSGFPGTIASGAAVGVFQEFGAASSPGACSGPGAPSIGACGTDQLAYVAAHEIGHWLGLYHVTESDGIDFDPLSDTSECQCNSCAPVAQQSTCSQGNVQMEASWCTAGASCGGGDNLMFWLLDPAYSKGTLSPDQGQVMRLNPAVR